nr:reverse transcriptase domain-containing protein [Tanacetum cinerariifolium]
MVDQRTMAQLLQAPIEGYEDAIVVPAITADNFKLKHGLLTLVQNKQFFGHDKEDPHAHIRYFNKINSTWKFPNIPNTSIKLMIFPFSLEDQDFLNFAARGNFLDKTPCECLAIIESKSEVRYSRDKPVVAKVSTNTTTSGVSPDVAELKDMVKALLLDKKAIDGNNYRDNIQEFISQASAVNYNQGNTSYRPPMMSNQIRPLGFPPIPNNQNVQRNNQNRFIPNQNWGNNFNQRPVYQPSVFQPPAYQAPAYQALAPQTQGQNMQNQLTNLTDMITKFVNSNTASTSSSGTLLRNTIANPKSDLKAITTRSGVSYDGPEATKDRPVTSPISELAIASVSASKPNPKASIPYPSKRNDERNHEKSNNQIKKFYQIFKDMSFEISFADALILMPKFASTLKALIGNKEKLSEMARTPLNEHCSLVLLKKLPKKLGDPGKFLIPCDFPGELTLRVGKEAITFNLDQTSRYSANYSDMTAKRIDVIDIACEEYSQEFLGFSDTISSGNPTPYYDSIVSATSPTLTPFENSDFLLEEVDTFLDIKDEPTLSEYHQSYLDPEGDILLLEAFLNDDPSLPLSNQRNYLPEVRKELKICEAKSDKSSVDEPPVVELKVLPPYLEYTPLEGNDKLPVTIAKDLSVEEKTALITVLKSHKRAIAWKLSDIKGINPEFCTHKILMEEDFEPTV